VAAVLVMLPTTADADADVIPPTIEVDAPAVEQIVVRGALFLADYSCADDVAVANCTGPVPDGGVLPVDELGEHDFVVTATDTSGNQAVTSTHYLVVPPRCDGEQVTVDLRYGESPTAGADIVFGRATPDQIHAGGGNDVIDGDAGVDRIFGQNGNDIIRNHLGRGGMASGGPGNDLLLGAADADRLIGGPGRDDLRSGRGADVVDGGTESDWCNGGPGPDRVVRCERG
jgi:Ca2+-binding RTX toxin-like protein